MNINFDVEIIKDKYNGSYILLNNRWALWSDGVIYDTQSAKDIPQWIFEFRDFVLKNYKEMRGQLI